MKKFKFRYILCLQFLGFRYHGWQPQKDIKTVQLMLERTFKYILKHNQFKLLGSSRTDAMVSAQDFRCQLFISESLEEERILKDLNQNLPMDIRCLDINQVDDSFNIIQDIKSKEYHYYFSFGEKPHPYTAPFSTHINGVLDIEKMQRAASLFLGGHDFTQFSYRTTPNKNYQKTIYKSKIIANQLFQGPLFSSNSWVYQISGNGFSHHQVRIMISSLIRLGKEEIDEHDIKAALQNKQGLNQHKKLGFVAPASGLHLHKVSYE